ncbi:cell division cycle-associated protein 3-like isoform X1 [Biomphalaria pfeifferi]|uniref:Cell division cycle-associated protein 3-like isoform X1 n=1 Tax=Biomphalaria pfeifferi TaxID=112525 RepID=A0AAD8C010_BIOPF|nr:cell division cycle-associated protein 3-like isoform X1 [Biomphalaria pfeifferi]
MLLSGESITFHKLETSSLNLLYIQRKVKNRANMGAYLDKFAEANDGAEMSTPTKITKLLHQKRLLALDPRSPSEGITRTPIIVEKTPVQQNGRFKLCSTEDEISRSFDRIKDPRSPTDAFTRTPINAGLLNTNRRLSPLVADFNSPASHHTETESGIESADVTPLMNIRHKLADETGYSQSPDSALSFDSWGQPFDIRHIQDKQNFEVDSLDPIMCEEEDDAEMEAIDVTSSPSIQSQLSTDVISTSARTSLELPSVLSPQLASAASHKAINVTNTPKLSLLVKKTGPLIWSEGVVRSPLSTVDNSLIQRKTAGGKKLKHSGVIDKENVFH